MTYLLYSPCFISITVHRGQTVYILDTKYGTMTFWVQPIELIGDSSQKKLCLNCILFTKWVKSNIFNMKFYRSVFFSHFYSVYIVYV